VPELAPEAATDAADKTAEAPPVLWHLKVSHYNEKARWALDYKQVPHLRRAAMGGPHRAIANKLSGGNTFPVAVLDGRAIGDSTQIIAALEQRYPAPPLYPEDADARRRALELEDFFDEELGAHTRLLALHHMLPDGRLFLGAFAPDLNGARGALGRAMFPLVRRRMTSEFGISEESVMLAYEKLSQAGEVFRGELGPGGYLVGGEFTVADLTLAALVAPLAAPAEFPYPQPQRGHPLLAPARDALAEAGILDWAYEIYARHRSASAEIVASDRNRTRGLQRAGRLHKSS
jgi:glutathione S-transferase